MEDNQNNNQFSENSQSLQSDNSEQKKIEKQADSGSIFLTQIQEKRAKYEQKNHKKSVFAQLVTPPVKSKILNKQNKKTKKRVPILGILTGVVALFLIFIILMVVVIAMGDANNALLVNFGIDESRLKDVLVAIVNASFGFTAFVFLLIFVISIFRVSLLKKEEKEKRKSILRQLFFALGFLLFVLVVWFSTWKVVDGIQLNIPLSQLEIKTSPHDLENLTAPIDINFDVTEIVEALFERGNNPETLEWDFDGDEIYETKTDEATIQHRFEQEGNIKVSLIVNLKNGQTQSFYKLIKIKQAEFLATPQKGTVPLKIVFDASNLIRTDSPAASFEWDFNGDGVYDDKLTTSKTNYIFDKIGIYTVGLRIIDLNNNFRTYTKKVEVVQETGTKLQADIKVTPTTQGIAPFKVTFSGVDSISTDGEIRDYEWNFGDNSGAQYGRVVSYTYETPGIYDVLLTVYDQNGFSSSNTSTIEVQKNSAIPVAKIISDPFIESDKKVLEGVVPFSVQFDASQSEDEDDNIVEYAWDLDGDGKYDEYGQKLDHVFETEGSFNVVLRVTDSDEQFSQTSFFVETRISDLQAILLAEPLSGALPLKVNFDASTSIFKKGNIVTYEWNFGDGEDSEYGAAKRTHIYDKEGKYTVKLKVITEDGQSAETEQNIFVRAVQLQSCFSYSPEKGEAPLTVEFDAGCTQGEVAKWKWDFGDGYISTSHSPIHTYNQKGEYSVSLDIIDEKNNSSVYQSVIIVE